MRRHLRDILLTIAVLAVCFACSVCLDYLQISEQITTAFAFAVFLISLMTDGYVWGLAAAAASVLLVNYAFTFPYFAFDFVSTSNFISALVMGFIAVLTGTLTTQIKHQETVRAEAEMERMRANLLRAVSHDLRTPLTTIYGSSCALRENRELLTPEQTDDMLRGIQEDSQWLVRMVENLLSVTRIDSGKVRINMTSTALDELVDAVVVKFRKRYPNQKVELSLPEELVMIPMDPILIQQVLINILENAVQHGTGLTWLELRVELDGADAVFFVSDDGCGIPETRLPRLFTGVYQPDDRPADNTKGNAGIGLSVCATIIRAHGGAIGAENRTQGGARFWFRLKTEDYTDEQ